MDYMEPRRLLAKLMEKSGDSPTSLAKKLSNATTQPQIYKFVNGMVREPRPHTLEPIANFYGIPLAALLRHEDAEKVMQERFGIDPHKVEDDAERKMDERRISVTEVRKYQPPQASYREKNDGDGRIEWGRYTDDLVAGELIDSLNWPYEVERNNSTRRSVPDFLILNHQKRVVCGIEVFQYQQFSGRMVSKAEIDRIYGFLWRMQHEQSYLGHYPIAAVIVVNDAEYQDTDKIVPESAGFELVQALNLAMRHQLLAGAALVGVNTQTKTDYEGAHYDRAFLTAFPVPIESKGIYSNVRLLMQMLIANDGSG